MCGIVGCIQKNYTVINRDNFFRAMTAVSDRGPDDSGFYIEDGVALGHRRLGIIDPEHNSQPLRSECNRFVITYNGEIYNYRELDKILVEHGINLAHKNDTAILLALFMLMGEKCLKLLNGMFAFAIWDEKEKKLFAARDRLGEKPFYYSLNNNGFYFGSTVASLKAFGLPSLTIDKTKVIDFLLHQYINKGSMYREIEKLEPGHYLTYSNLDGVRIERYWNLSPSHNTFPSKSEAISTIRSLVEDSTKLRLRSDVPLGIFLSGGVDSSIITSCAVKHLSSVNTFCAGFDEASYDESQLAAKASEFYGTSHRELKLSSNPPDLLDILSHLAQIIGEPFADPSIVPTWQLCKMAAKHVKVALSGDGADEIFGGYRRYYAAKYGDLFLKSDGAAALLSSLAKIVPDSHKYFSKSLPKKIILLNKYISHKRSWPDDRLPKTFSESELALLLGEELQHDFSQSVDFEALNTELQKHQKTDMHYYLPNDILVKTDRISMHFGLEVRTPFLDHRIAEYALYFPDSFKISFLSQKNILKESYRNELLTDVVNKPKHGFASPLHQWLSQPLVPLVESAIVDESLAEFFNLQYVVYLWRQHQGGYVDNSHKLWCILIFYIWLKNGAY